MSGWKQHFQIWLSTKNAFCYTAVAVTAPPTCDEGTHVFTANHVGDCPTREFAEQRVCAAGQEKPRQVNVIIFDRVVYWSDKKQRGEFICAACWYFMHGLAKHGCSMFDIKTFKSRKAQPLFKYQSKRKRLQSKCILMFWKIAPEKKEKKLGN